MESVILTSKELATTLDSEIFKAYKEKISSYGSEARKSLNIFSNKNGDLAGSNCFAPIILRDLLPENSRLATMADLERATEKNPGFLRGFYSDTGLTLRIAGDSCQNNDFLAKNLANQLRTRGISLKYPKAIYFDALDLEENKDSAYGLVYKLNERVELGRNIINTHELIENFKFKTMDEKGIPIKDTKGSRKSYAGTKGLSRFYLGRTSITNSSSKYLAASHNDGRVVVVNTRK